MFRKNRNQFGSYGSTRKRSRAGKIGKILLVILIVLILAAGAAAWYVFTPYTPTSQAEQALVSGTDKIAVQDTEEWISFSNAKPKGNSIIFYPGARVKPEAYSVFAHDLAKSGHTVYIMKLPFNFAFFKTDAAQAVIDRHPDEKFVIGGHSLGGVFAARYAAAHLDHIAGVFFLASYPEQKGNLQKTDIPVLSITASNDGLLKKDTYEAARAFLPQQTVYYSIEGGNHAQFGSYGEQKDDLPAQIDADEQRKQTVNTILGWMKEIPTTSKSATKK
ncbi:alpha/beta fold hydrolase [Paenibacillus sp. PsM32]|uniref:Alpha/beta fold hydrolase n=1 Tax=Paenibacillus kyungheensis TaxID=1452732 RepID=A0AAX3LZT7_9BACL|nr:MULTISPECIES: alpha/beta fold hydrolase [Paenibacillus]MDN4618794.1 alpha/beta fold hydrolase [Paenibacillus sp. PsM32]MDQ1235301.1 dienelactone hydrolase [Paenibacillus sp. SORGH_AS_0306]MDR6112350.1 dienelactone hydrolase [Paenibacillus sp. SORGH_AS_0338]WCT54846.1 alpha/beta fold hydrolase [Paenibacillus kyungheensis]